MIGKIWLGRSNVVDVELSEADVLLPDHTVVTRVQVDLDEGTYVLDSSTDPTWFDLTNTDKIVLDFGAVTGVPAGQYTAEIVVYTADYANGLIWVEDFQLTFE